MVDMKCWGAAAVQVRLSAARTTRSQTPALCSFESSTDALPTSFLSPGTRDQE